jgi:hypothetical protein
MVDGFCLVFTNNFSKVIELLVVETCLQATKRIAKKIMEQNVCLFNIIYV